METQANDALETKQVNLKTEKFNVETLMNHGSIHAPQGFHVQHLMLQRPLLRTPLQLFKASASVTAGVLFTAGVVSFASRALDYIISLF